VHARTGQARGLVLVHAVVLIPAHLKQRDMRTWHLPTISMNRGAPLLRFAISETVADPDTAGAAAALGIDWSPASLGAVTVVAETDAGLVTDARTHVYNDRGLGARLRGPALLTSTLVTC